MLISIVAEHRGPGNRQQYDSGDDFDHDLDQQPRGVHGRSGRIILLGDGTEVLTDSDEQEMFDHDEEDRDLEAQVSKGQSQANREATREPESEKAQVTSHTPESMETGNPFDSPSSNITEKSISADDPPPYIKAASNSDLPSKLVNPPTGKS